MNRIKLICAVLAVFVFAALSVSAQKKEPPKVNVTKLYTKGLNLSIWLEPGGFGNIGKCIYGKQDFENIKNLGIEIIRIPIWFEEYSSGKPDYIVEDWLWESIDNAVEWCEEFQIYMIIDFHNNCSDGHHTKPDVEKMLVKIWKQIAERYKDKSEYVLYEIMNEPHLSSGNIEADIRKWGKIQGNVLKEIRNIDKKHTVIVGGEQSNGLDAMLKLPDYKDDNIIYNFHDYTPFLFTHQGAEWWNPMSYFKHVPFPYVKEKMPPVPENATDEAKRFYKNYEKDASEKNLVEPLDKAVEFANKRNAALMCNEYGVMMNYADEQERANWYAMKTKWMKERNIIRVSWDYTGKFGIFNHATEPGYPMKNLPQFPQDLNENILRAMELNPVKKEAKIKQKWFTLSKQKGSYDIYTDSFAEGIIFEGLTTPWETPRVDKTDSTGGEKYIWIEQCNKYNVIIFGFDEAVDFTDLVNKNAVLEFEVRTNQKGLEFETYFRDKLVSESDENGFEWRSSKYFGTKDFPPDGKWHKVSIPLKDFKPTGAWLTQKEQWVNDKGLYSWKKVDALVFSFTKDIKNGISIRNIAIR
ncbi:MAG: cellulase family glycosylhydrolase [Spirochaetaceae bacterium]|nr:cellulase family glycosylhydrolase [Spirochaetaceae bacterium]